MIRDSRSGLRVGRRALAAGIQGFAAIKSVGLRRGWVDRGLISLGVLILGSGFAGAAEESFDSRSPEANRPAEAVGTAGTSNSSASSAASDPRPGELVLPARRPSQGGGPGIESLLHLPSSFTGAAQGPEVAGATESGWRRRFRQTNESLAEARAALEATKVALDGAADGGGANQWSVAAPGGGGDVGSAANSGSPLSFKLRQALRKNRADLESAEKAMKELVIEADLAGVPEGWRGNPAETGDRPLPEVGQILD